MAAPTIITGTAFEDSQPRLWGLLEVEDGSAGTPAVAADVASMSFKVFDGCDQVEVEGDDGELAVEDVVLDELVNGFNVRIKLPAGYLPNGDRTYRVEAAFTLVVDDEVATGVWEITTVGLQGS